MTPDLAAAIILLIVFMPMAVWILVLTAKHGLVGGFNEMKRPISAASNRIMYGPKKAAHANPALKSDPEQIRLLEQQVARPIEDIVSTAETKAERDWLRSLGRPLPERLLPPECTDAHVMTFQSNECVRCLRVAD